MTNYLKALIVGAEEAIEDVKLNLQLDNGISCTLASIDSAVNYVKPLLEYEKQGVETLTPKPSEWLKFLERKRYEVQDPDHLFENLRAAYSADDFYPEELEELIQNCKDSNNVHDILALAIIYKKLNKNYDTAVTLFCQYISAGYSNPCYTPVQLLFMLAELHQNNNNPIGALKTYEQLIDIEPNNPMIYVNTIKMLNKINQPELAKQALNSAKNTEYYHEIDYFKYIIDNYT